jgi:hypothetical protein
VSKLRELPWRVVKPMIRVLDDRVRALSERLEEHTSALQVGTETAAGQRYAALDGRLAALAEQQRVDAEVMDEHLLAFETLHRRIERVLERYAAPPEDVLQWCADRVAEGRMVEVVAPEVFASDEEVAVSEEAVLVLRARRPR